MAFNLIVLASFPLHYNINSSTLSDAAIGPYDCPKLYQSLELLRQGRGWAQITDHYHTIVTEPSPYSQAQEVEGW